MLEFFYQHSAQYSFIATENENEKKKVLDRVENIVRKGEIACYKQFLLSDNVFHSYISLVCQNAALCGNGLNQSLERTMAELRIGSN